MMKRRDTLKLGFTSIAGLASHRVYAAPEDYTGRFFVTVQADGAWDVSSFCDPKSNIADEKVINNWASTTEIKTAGNINYAPFANNESFFNKYYQDILIINGIDAQTNSHSTGVLHNWSGKNSAGYPSLTALFATMNAPDLPLAYLNYGGYSETARLIRYTRLDEINSLINVLQPNTAFWDRNQNMHHPSLLTRIKEHQKMRLERMKANEAILPRQAYAMESYYAARENSAGLKDFAAIIPEADMLQGSVALTTNVNSNLMTQMQITSLAFKSGVGCAADFHLGGFDTHADHDQDHAVLLGHLTDAVDYFWTYAEEQGIADRVTMLISSDFSRTPFYNGSNGKDHWPIGSAMIMEKNASWTNRVIGQTDSVQNAQKTNPETGLRDDTEGTIIYPKHVHKALRKHLGLDSSALSTGFPFTNVEDFKLFT